MQILSFDSSGSDVHLAFVLNGTIALQVIAKPAQKNRQEAASSLLPLIDKHMKELGWHKHELDLIVVGAGPGSFTGLRVSVITARSLGQALACAVYPVSMLESIASKVSLPAAIVLNAGAGKFYAGAYKGDLLDGSGAIVVEPFCGTKNELAINLGVEDRWIVAPDLVGSDLAEGKNVESYPEDSNWASAAALLAYQRISISMQKLDRESLAHAYPWDNVLPLYLRSPSVTIKAENESSNKTPAGG